MARAADSVSRSGAAQTAILGMAIVRTSLELPAAESSHGRAITRISGPPSSRHFDRTRILLHPHTLGAGKFESACNNCPFRGRDWSVTCRQPGLPGVTTVCRPTAAFGPAAGACAVDRPAAGFFRPTGGGPGTAAGVKPRVVAVEREGDRIDVGVALPDAAEIVWRGFPTTEVPAGQVGEPVKV